MYLIDSQKSISYFVKIQNWMDKVSNRYNWLIRKNEPLIFSEKKLEKIQKSQKYKKKNEF